jgi:hypothetical protein
MAELKSKTKVLLFFYGSRLVFGITMGTIILVFRIALSA